MSDADPKGAESGAEPEENGLKLDDDESQQLQEVFSTIFPQYMEPLEELVSQLVDGQTSPEIIEGLRGAVTPLVGAADTIGVTKLKTLLEEFQAIVEKIGEGGAVGEPDRDAVIDVFYRLKEAVHAMGDGEANTGGPEPSVEKSDFVARLSAIEGVGPSELQRILAAGITSPAHVASARVDEIAAVTGLSEALAGRIHQAFGGQPRSRSGGGGTSGGGEDEEPNLHPFEPADLEARFGLAQAVRERILLRERLAQEQAVLDRTQARAEELDRALVLGRSRLQQRRDELTHEREMVDSAEASLQRLRDEIAAVQEETTERLAGGDDEDLGEVQDRLRELNRRINAQLRGE